MPSDCLKIIESKSRVRESRAKAVVAKVNSSSSTPAISSDVAELKEMVRALLLDKKNQSSAPTTSLTPAPVKAVESNCVTCGGTHSYQNCPATSGNVYQDNIYEYVSQAAAANYNQGNTGFRPQMVANQIRPPGFPLVQNNQNNFNRGNNFTQNRGGSGTLSGNTVTNSKEDLKGITTQSGVAYQGPTTPTPSKVIKQDRSVSKPIGIAKDVSVKVGMFHFPADFMVIDFEPDPRVPLILGWCFLKTGRALIDVHKGKLTLRIGNEAITYNLDQTSRYSANDDQMTTNKIDVTDEAYEEYFQEVLGFFDVTACEAKTIKSFVDEPPEVELKDLPPHLEYVFLEGNNKLPVIFAKELGDEEKAALIKVL
nr:reverse transcriptase domain-containing protein [Tanacetum cinerariifolium]